MALARRDRSLVDASNLGLSLSIEELATNPEAVVAETARSLRIPPSVASRILASIGMTLLLGGDNEGTNTADLLDGSVSDADSTPNATTRLETPARGAKRTYEPTMGTFAPAGNVELCVVVAPQANQPVPSPFSARKRRRISHVGTVVEEICSQLSIKPKHSCFPEVQTVHVETAPLLHLPFRYALATMAARPTRLLPSSFNARFTSTLTTLWTIVSYQSNRLALPKWTKITTTACPLVRPRLSLCKRSETLHAGAACLSERSARNGKSSSPACLALHITTPNRRLEGWTP